MTTQKTYEKPAILSTDNLEVKAVACTKSDSGTCSAGPLSS